MRTRHRGVVTVYRGLPVAAEPSGEQRLAAAVIGDALNRARRGDVVEAQWITTPRRLAPWAGALAVTPERLAQLARAALRSEDPED